MTLTADTVRFEYTDQIETWNVPNNVVLLQIEAIGAKEAMEGTTTKEVMVPKCKVGLMPQALRNFKSLWEKQDLILETMGLVGGSFVAVMTPLDCCGWRRWSCLL